MIDRNTPMSAKDLIKLLETLPPDTDVYFNGIVSWNNGFINVDLPVSSVKKIKTYADSNYQYIELFGVQREDEVN